MAENAGLLQSYSILGDRSYALSWPRYVARRELVADTAETITVPTNASVALFAATADFAVSYNQGGTAFVAGISGDADDGTAAELNPTVRYIAGCTSLSVISNAACVLTVAFYRA